MKIKILTILVALMLAACNSDKYSVERGAVDEAPAADPVDTYEYPVLRGGTDAAPGEFPWLVAIQGRLANGTWKIRCHGALYSANYVITSASCVDGVLPANIRVVAGLQDQSDLTGSQTETIDSYTMHASYGVGAEAFANDLAVLNLHASIVIGGNIQLAVLPADNSNDYNGLTVVCAGWARTSASLIPSNILQKASIGVISTAQADSFPVLNTAVIGPNQIFVFDMAESVSCGGDLLQGPDGVTRVMGVASYLPAIGVIAYESYPSVFTRLSAYLAWIAANTP